MFNWLLPPAKRVRPGLERSHRASILLQNDDAILVETEYLPDAQAPRERFVAPIRCAIFIHGHAPGEPQAPSPVQPLPRQYVPEGDIVVDHLDEVVDLGLEQQQLIRQDYGASECWFQGPPLKSEQKKLAPGVVRLHRNLGHPRTEDLVRAMVQNGRMDPEAINLARRLKCATCERTRKPLPPRPTSLKSVGAFNEKICMDYVFLHDIEGKKHGYLHILDPGGCFNVFAWIPSRNPSDVLDVFHASWANWAGYPRKLWADQDGAFECEFADAIGKVCDFDCSAAETHWQTGEIESFNRAFRYTAEKLIDEHQLSGDDNMKSLGVIVGAAMNDKVRMNGASANQWVFGKSPEMPYDLLDREGQVEALQGQTPDEELRLRQRLRALADMHISQYKIDDSLRRAVSRQGRPSRMVYEPGELIAFWRNVKKKKGKMLKPGLYRGTIIGPHKGDDSGNQNNYWVTTNGKLILVSKEQRTERWRIQEDELQNFLDDEPKEFQDETGDGPQEDDELGYPNETLVAPLEDEIYSPSVKEEPEEHQQEMEVADVQQPGQLQDQASSFSNKTDETQPHPDSPLVSRAPGTPVAGLFRKPDPTSGTISEPSSKRLRTGEPGDTTPPIALEENDAPEEPHTVLQNNKFVPSYKSEHFARPDHVLECLRQGKRRRFCFVTRNEQKALEREVPWHMIPIDQRPGYRAALVNLSKNGTHG